MRFLENSPQGILLYKLNKEKDLILTYSNDATDSILGAEIRTFWGKPLEEVFPALAETDIPNLYREIALEGGTLHRENLAYIDGAITGAYDLVAFQIAPSEMAVYFTDITAQKQLIQQVELRSKELVAKNEEMESLLYAASHDLRSPLVNIQGFSARLEKFLGQVEPTMLPEQQEIVRSKMNPALMYIKESSQKMDRLIAGLLNLSRLGRQSIAFGVVNVENMLKGLRKSLAHQIHEARAEVLEGDLPEVWCDMVKLEQVFSNLMDNALKYRSPDRSLIIRIQGKVSENAIEYRISDNGLGIDPSQKDKIWSLFYRILPRSDIPGEGLGLTAVKRIVERLNGRVEVNSDGKTGSEFVLTLPRNHQKERI